MTVDRNVADVQVGDAQPVRVMGVLNLGPDSFYKGSVVSTVHDAVARAEQMVAEGADFLDLGAMSTAPGVKPVSLADEQARLLPVLEAVLAAVDVPVSVDTYRAPVAEAAINAGARIINDVSGFIKDPRMVDVIAEYDVPAVVMATRKVIGDTLSMQDILDSLKNSLHLVEATGYDSTKVIVDPGIGRWVPEKTYQYNLDIIRDLNRLSELDRLVLIGISRKSFIHEILDRPDPNDRLPATLAATAVAVINGAHIVRTHDVAQTFDAVKIAKMLSD